MTRKLLSFGLFILIYGFILKPAHADLELNITQGSLAPIPIAVANLQGASSQEAMMADKITEVIKNDLGTCGLFNLLDPSSFIQKPASFAKGIHFSEWRLIKADNLMIGSVTQQSDGKIRIEFRLYDTVRELQIEGQAYTASANEWRRVAHKIADTIYQRLIGDEGYFDTQIVYISRVQVGKKRVERLAIMDQDGENHKYLTSGDTLVLTPRLSPDLKTIAYLDYATRNRPRVYFFDRTTGRKTEVGHFPGMTFAPRFSPDGKHLIMSFSKDGNTSLFEMNLETRKIKRLTLDSVIDTSPCYSPDGSKIVFNSDRTGNTHIYIMDASGGSAQRISFGQGNYRTPAWSPRGDWIAFTKMFQGEFYIGVMRPDGSGERLITKGFLVEGPAWSKNGRVILFTRDDRNDRPRLHMIDLTGYNEREVPTPTNAVQGFWSHAQ